MRRLGRVEQLLNMMKDIGVPAQHIYDLNINIKGQGQRLPCPMYKISGYKRYDVSVYKHIRSALEKYLMHGPMLAVFWISANYDDCMESGSVYRFSGVHVLQEREEEDEDERVSHAVRVVSFGIEETVPFLTFRTDKAGWPEFGRVEIQSIRELYGIKM